MFEGQLDDNALGEEDDGDVGGQHDVAKCQAFVDSAIGDRFCAILEENSPDMPVMAIPIAMTMMNDLRLFLFVSDHVHTHTVK